MKKSGFTLIELIFVIVIIGLLAAVAVPKFLTTKKNAETANLPEVGQQIVTKANEQYEIVHDSNLSKIIKNDKNINNYVTNEIKAPFMVLENNDTNFTIGYSIDGNKSNAHTCLTVARESTSVAISPDANVTTYNFLITDLNTSCNTQ